MLLLLLLLCLSLRLPLLLDLMLSKSISLPLRASCDKAKVLFGRCSGRWAALLSGVDSSAQRGSTNKKTQHNVLVV